MRNSRILLLLLLVSSFPFSIQTFLPIVAIPGIIDAPGHLNILCFHIQKYHPGQKCTVIQDTFTFLYIRPMWELVEHFRKLIQPFFDAYPNGMHIVAHSQGTLVARAIIQTTNNHPVKTFVSLAGPQMGFYGITLSDQDSPTVRKFIRTVSQNGFTDFVYGAGAQEKYSYAGYWKDPHNMDRYLTNSKFLPSINNEVPHNLSATYKNNFERLDKLVTVGGPYDHIIKPWQSSHFEYYDENENVVPLRNMTIYTENTFGLKTIDQRGGLFRYITKANHMTLVENSQYLKIVMPHLT